MPKTIYETFKDFPSFYKQLKPRFGSDFRIKDLITNILYSTQVYETYKHDTHYNDSDTALNKIFSQIVFDCAEIRKKELLLISFKLMGIVPLPKIKVKTI